jgi:ABC-2 type transport system permease protein
MAKMTNASDAGHFRRLKALITKEFYQIIRDPSSILISGLLPLILLFIYGSGVSLDIDHLNVGLVLEDTSPDATSFAQTLTDSRYFNIKLARDRRELDHDLMRGALRGIVIVPSYFSAFREKPDQPAPIMVIADGSEPNTAKFVTNYVQGAWQLWLQQERISSDVRGLPLIGIQPRFWFNEQLESRNYLIPGSLAIIMTLIGTLLTALVIAREWERGTMEAMMSTPVSIVELLVGKLIPYYFLAMATLVLVVGLALLFYNIPFRGSWVALFVISGAFLFPALGLGLLISTVARTQLVAAQIAIVSAFLPAFILSGFLFEISSMPILIQILTYIIPARYYVSCLQTLFLVGDDWSLFARNIFPMLLVGTFFFGITARKTVKRLD